MMASALLRPGAVQVWDGGDAHVRGGTTMVQGKGA